MENGTLVGTTTLTYGYVELRQEKPVDAYMGVVEVEGIKYDVYQDLNKNFYGVPAKYEKRATVVIDENASLEEILAEVEKKCYKESAAYQLLVKKIEQAECMIEIYHYLKDIFHLVIV